VAVLGTLLAMSIPAFGSARARARGEGAGRCLLTMCRSARFEAARLGASVGLRFEPQGGRVAIRAHVDGDGDGISSADLLDGTDPPLGPARYLEDDFPGVAIAIVEPLPGIDGGTALTPSSSPLQIGSRGVLSFTPDGQSSGGTVYLTAANDTAHAVRVQSSTGRARVLRYARGTSQWDVP
jgi:type II secretory pathway pseudopilin PulG